MCRYIYYKTVFGRGLDICIVDNWFASDKELREYKEKYKEKILISKNECIKGEQEEHPDKLVMGERAFHKMVDIYAHIEFVKKCNFKKSHYLAYINDTINLDKWIDREIDKQMKGDTSEVYLFNSLVERDK